MNLGMIYLVRHAHAGNKRNWDGPDTRRPLSDERRVTVELDPRLDVDAEAAGAAALLEDPAPGGAVLCTHGELIGQLLGRLRRAGAPIAADAAWPKGSTWVLHPTTDRIAQATYLPPLRHAD